MKVRWGWDSPVQPSLQSEAATDKNSRPRFSSNRTSKIWLNLIQQPHQGEDGDTLTWATSLPGTTTSCLAIAQRTQRYHHIWTTTYLASSQLRRDAENYDCIWSSSSLASPYLRGHPENRAKFDLASQPRRKQVIRHNVIHQPLHNDGRRQVGINDNSKVKNDILLRHSSANADITKFHPEDTQSESWRQEDNL